MRRRAFIAALGGAAAWPLAVCAQQISKPARLGYIWIGAKDSEHSTRDGLRQGLRDLGYVEGRDFVLEERYADSQPDRLPQIVTELMRLNVALFLSPGVQVTRPLVHGTSLGLQIGAYRRIELRRIAHHFAPVLRLEPGILVIARPVKAGRDPARSARGASHQPAGRGALALVGAGVGIALVPAYTMDRESPRSAFPISTRP